MGSLAAQFHERPSPVSAQTLDSILEELSVREVDILKVDVEGYEGAVFKGAQRVLKAAHAPVVLFEFADWAETRAGVPPGYAQTLLRDYGYSIWHLSDFMKRRAGPCRDVIRGGFEMFVATRTAH